MPASSGWNLAADLNTGPAIDRDGPPSEAYAREIRQGIQHPQQESMVLPVFATLIPMLWLACVNLFGVLKGITPRATMRVAPNEPQNDGGFI
jgi:hypothetical protein